MLFKNLTSGLIWEVNASDHIKRCTNDSDYEEVQPKKKVEKNEKVKPKKSNEVGE